MAPRSVSRSRFNTAAFLLTGCLAITGLWAAATAKDVTRKGTPGEVRLVFGGDIMLDRDPGVAMLEGKDPFAGVADLLLEADLTVGNVECVVADSGAKLDKPYTFRADPKAVPYLVKYFDGVSLANNHTGDFGDAALIETMYRLHRQGLPFFGAGLNNAEAHTPWIVEKNGVKIAMLGYNEFRPRSFEAGPRKPGLAWSEDAMVVEDIKATRPKADIVVTFMHWGEEYILEPNERQRTLARKMIDAGADIVIGNHPHVTQGHEIYKDRLIVYSLGNFVFDEWKDEPEIMKEERRIGWLVQVTVTKAGVVEWNSIVTRTDDVGFPQKVAGAKGPGGKVNAAAAKTR